MPKMYRLARILKVFVGLCALGIWFIIIFNSFPDKYERIEYNTEQWTSKFSLNACRIPHLDPFAEEVVPYIHRVGPVRCNQTANSIGVRLFELVKGTRLLKKISSEDDENNCCYRPFIRMNDQIERTSMYCFRIVNHTTEIPEMFEFIEIFCTTPYMYSDGFAIVSRDKMKHKKLKNSEHALDLVRLRQHKKLNVIILGIDGISRMNFLRKMPKTRSYLLNSLSAVELKGYAKVAENTLPNVVPLLTGLTLDEMKSKCVPDLGYFTHIDNCPFIWKNFSRNGYITGYAEDDIDIGCFNLNWKYAFKNQPTDFYFRPFAQLMQRRHSTPPFQCLGTRLSFQTLLDNIESLAIAMNNYSSYFQYTWATRLTHDDINRLSLADKPLLETLVFMNGNGYLDNTALILVSDHGARQEDGIRTTDQGQLEDRLPMAYIVMPAWFKDEHPSEWANLNSNSEKLTSPFDIYETLSDLMQLDKLQARSSPITTENVLLNNMRTQFRQPSSLFQPLSSYRTCSQAGIPMHWCYCLDKTPVNTYSEDAVAGAEFVVKHINAILSHQWGCRTLYLSSIIEVFEVHKEEINRKDTATDLVMIDMVRMLRISLETKPGGAKFEATIIKVNDEWKVTERPARINRYQGQTDCIQQQELKPYCYC